MVGGVSDYPERFIQNPEKNMPYTGSLVEASGSPHQPILRQAGAVLLPARHVPPPALPHTPTSTSNNAL